MSKPYCYSKYGLHSHICQQCGFRTECFRLNKRTLTNNEYYRLADKYNIYAKGAELTR